MTISGEPENNNPLNYGKLVARINRPTDHPLLNFYVGDVDPQIVGNNEYWNLYLKSRHHNYAARPLQEKPDYALIPSDFVNTRNSNSYARGVIQDSPANSIISVPPTLGARYPGWNLPVPDYLFR